MTVSELSTTPASSLDELAERVDTIARDVNRTPVLSVIRGLLNETGIRKARAVLNDAPDVLANAQESLRVAQEAERTARESYDAAVLEASWLIDAQFVQDGNKQYLVIGEGPEATRKPMLAAEKATYIAAAVAKMPEVDRAAAVLRTLSHDVDAARDDVEIAKARMSAAKYDVQAAIAELEILRLSIPTKENA